MDDEGAVAEEGGGAGGGGEVEVEEAVRGVMNRSGCAGKGGNKRGLPGGEGAHHDFAVLAGQIADLACLRHGWVAWGHLAADVGVLVGEGAGAVAVGGDGLVMDVVYWDIVLVGFFAKVCLILCLRRREGD